MLDVAIDLKLGAPVTQPGQQPVAEAAKPRHLIDHFIGGDLTSQAESDAKRHRERPRPNPAFLAATVEQWREADAGPAAMPREYLPNPNEPRRQSSKSLARLAW